MPGFIVTKKATHTPSDRKKRLAAVGETVYYTITAKNTGNVDITGTVVADPMFGSAEGGSKCGA